ncbi:GNAT family N-acetyltransferase [Nocardioides sp. SYSU D00038]|uniref:GNAT family N-acetyltransferase n=1 Tax=Nocardioides sp. SYSU D00038 TaxID=2812554 RepID=UPI001967034F|nr:GNAT family N-acetyltransferase [Nocardioides sp. SYSU D00038]
MPTDPQLTLRPAGPGDADAVASVYLAARAVAPMPPGVHPEAEVRAWLASRIAVDEVWVAEVADQVVGYARLTPAWLDDLYVHPDHARRGVGSALLDLATSLRPRGFCLWVFESNRPARAFYAARGLVELERTDGSANEERAPDVRMAWPGTDPVTFLRGLVDEVDEQLGDLLNRRAALTAAVQAVKPSTDRDPVREAEIARAMAERAPALGPARLERIVHTIITESLDACGR